MWPFKNKISPPVEEVLKYIQIQELPVRKEYYKEYTIEDEHIYLKFVLDDASRLMHTTLIVGGKSDVVLKRKEEKYLYKKLYKMYDSRIDNKHQETRQRATEYMQQILGENSV